MIDRLKQLRSRNPNIPYTSDSQHIIAVKNDSENGENKYLDTTQEGISEDFLDNMKRAKSLMTHIRQNNDRIKQLRARYSKAIKGSQEKQVSEELDGIVRDNRDVHANLKGLLAQIKEDVEAAEKDPEQMDEPETRMKKNFYHAITAELSKTLEEQRIQEDSFKNTVKEKVTRQVRLIDKDLTDEEVENYVNNPEEAQQMLQKKIYGQASVNLRNAVSDIQDKFRDIQKLEKSVAECLQLFKQLAMLVQQQGEAIDSIEAHVNQTKDYMEKADKHLTKAKKHHQCAKKYMCWIILGGVIILICILAPVLSKAIG